MPPRSKTALTIPDLVVLSTLAQAPMHGYQLNMELERCDVKDWAGISRPQVYYSLNKLNELKCIRSIFGDESIAGPDRQTYAVTEKGKKALSDALGSEKWATQRPPPPFLTWLALSTHANKETTRKIIQLRADFLQREIIREKETLKAIRADSCPMTKPGVLMVDLTIKQFELELEWLGAVKKEIGGIGK